MVWNGSKKASMKFMMLSVHMDTLCHFSQFSRIFSVKIQIGGKVGNGLKKGHH
jgi:hypothetical protein